MGFTLGQKKSFAQRVKNETEWHQSYSWISDPDQDNRHQRISGFENEDGAQVSEDEQKVWTLVGLSEMNCSYLSARTEDATIKQEAE